MTFDNVPQQGRRESSVSDFPHNPDPSKNTRQKKRSTIKGDKSKFWL